MYPISSNNLNYETDTEVYFFTTAFHPLDNFSAHEIRIWDTTFPTVEHAFQWKKFSASHPKIAEEILVASSPDAVKKISDTNKHLQPSTWKEEKVSAMEQILNAKADQHEDVKEVLKKTGTRTIIENSPVDNFWGIGPEGEGKNMVGKIWMSIRARFFG